MKPLVLIWSEDADFYVLLSYILVKEGFCTAIGDDADIVAQASSRPVSAIFLESGNRPARAAALCEALKAESSTASIPTIALVSSCQEKHYLELLRAGVDESFVRPVSPSHLIAYLGSVIARRPASTASANGIRSLSSCDLEMQTERRRVIHNGAQIELSPIEFKLFCHLSDSPGRVFSRSELIKAAWPPNLFVQPRTVDVHMGRLRRALQELTGRSLIRTIRASGYAAE